MPLPFLLRMGTSSDIGRPQPSNFSVQDRWGGIWNQVTAYSCCTWRTWCNWRSGDVLTMAGYTVDGKNIHTQSNAPQIAMLNYNFWLGFMGDIIIVDGFINQPIIIITGVAKICMNQKIHKNQKQSVWYQRTDPPMWNLDLDTVLPKLQQTHNFQFETRSAQMSRFPRFTRCGFLYMCSPAKSHANIETKETINDRWVPVKNRVNVR